MSHFEIHYGGQSYSLDPKDADDFLVKTQLKLMQIRDGAEIVTAKLRGGKSLHVLVSRSIPLAIVQGAERSEGDAPRRSGRMTVS